MMRSISSGVWMLHFCINALQAQEGSLHTDLSFAIDMVVAADGTGDYSTLQSAVDAVPDNHSGRTVMFIKKGVYREKIVIPSSKRNLTMIGEDADSTLIVWDDYAGKIVDGVALNTFTSQTIRIDADDFTAMNMTFMNDARPGGTGDGQNVAVSAYGKRNMFLHCKMIAWQDTYYSGSDDRHYFKDCFIEGAIDYIFGHTTVVFDSCQIHSVRSSGYITAASTLENYRFGYVFFNCRLTAPPGISGVYLGRPWKTYAQTVFFQCIEYENIHPKGWHVWGGREETCFYAEYRCTGPGSDTSGRVDWAHQLTPVQAQDYTLDNIFSRASSPAFADHWDPAPEQDTLWEIVKDHTTMFMDPVNLDAGIESLHMDGAPLPGWDPGVFEYSVELPSDTVEIPVLSATARNPLSTVTITYPESLPGWSEITVLANDRATHSIYRLYFSVDGSYTNSRLDSILVMGEPIGDFDPGILEYDVILPGGTSKYFGLTAYPQVPEATVVTTRPASLPGVATIGVTAVNGDSTSIYKLNITLTTGREMHSREAPAITVINPASEQVTFTIDSPGSFPVRIMIYDITGRMRAQQLWVPDHGKGTAYVQIDTWFGSGIYLYLVQSGNFLQSGKFIKR